MTSTVVIDGATAPDDGATGATGGTGAAGRRRRWSHPGQKLLALLAAGVIVGAFMPWIETPLGTYQGFAGPGRVLFYAGVLGLGGGLVPVRSLAVVQGAVMALAAVVLPLWQVARLISLVGFQGWAPGVGLLLVAGCGLMAARVTVGFARPAHS